MSFSIDYSGLAVVHLLRAAVLLLHALVSWLLSDGADLGSSSSATRPPRPSAAAKAIKDSLHVSTYGEIIGEEDVADDEEEEEEEERDDQDGEEGCCGSTGATCAVCLNLLRRRDEVRELRNCRHVFHRGCIDRWVDHDEHGTCPLCRAPLLHPSSSSSSSSSCPPPPAEPSWAVDRMLYLFGDDLLASAPSSF